MEKRRCQESKPNQELSIYVVNGPTAIFSLRMSRVSVVS